jgi:hypothetical protein
MNAGQTGVLGGDKSMSRTGRLGISAAAVLTLAVAGCQSTPAGAATAAAPTVGPSAAIAATATAVAPSASPAPLAKGSFGSHGGKIQLDVTGDGPTVTGKMIYTDEGNAANGGFVVNLVCTRTTNAGLILIGGPIIEATNAYFESAPVGSNIALILQPGTPVKAEINVEHPDPHEPSCSEYLDSISDERPAGALEPITGTIELRP